VYRDVKIGNWGNAAFAAFNAATASYALVALMGVQNAIVDIWLGFVERLYVPEKSAKPVVRDRQRRPAPVASGPSWEDVLYRGAAATATGEHVSAGTGMFRILATPPPAAVRHNRRASDRSGGAHNRRASDRAGTAADRAGDAGDRAGGASDRAGGASDRAGGAADRAGSAADRAGSPADRAGSAADRTGSANDRTGSSNDRATKGSE
jgi:hypothetical protein